MQTTEPTWILVIHRKLVNFKERSRKNNLQVLGIKENPTVSSEECENNIYDLLQDNLENEA